MDVTALAESGATAVITAMASEAWAWTRGELARLLTGSDRAREADEIARLDGYAGDLTTMAERDVYNRVHGYLEARLSDDVTLRDDFFSLVRKICVEVGLEPPTSAVVQQITTNNGMVVNLAGNAQVHVGTPSSTLINWTAMPAPEAARLLEKMDIPAAVEALTNMEPGAAARRLSHLRTDRASDLLSQVDEEFAAKLLLLMSAPAQAATFLAEMQPSRAAAVLDLTTADWTVARLAEMEPSQAVLLLGEMGAMRAENLLDAMERQQTVSLLRAVGKVLTDQVRIRTTFDLAQQEADAIRAAAREEAAQIREEAERLREEAARGIGTARALPVAAEDDPPPSPVGEADQSTAATQPATAPIEDDGGGFLLPVEYFLLGHDSDGRARIEQTALETGVAGAVLCELSRAHLIAVSDGCAVPVDSGTCGDPLGDFVFRSLAAASPMPIQAWLRLGRRELFLRTAQQLAESGTIVPLSRRWPRHGKDYRPTNEASASEPGIRLVRHLMAPADQLDEHTSLLAALVNITQLHAALPVDLRLKRTRQLLAGLVKAQTLHPDQAAVLNGVAAALAAEVMTPRLH